MALKLLVIRINKSINLRFFTLILKGAGVPCDVDIFKLTAHAQSIHREVYEYTIIHIQDCNDAA